LEGWDFSFYPQMHWFSIRLYCGLLLFLALHLKIECSYVSWCGLFFVFQLPRLGAREHFSDRIHALLNWSFNLSPRIPWSGRCRNRLFYPVKFSLFYLSFSTLVSLYGTAGLALFNTVTPYECNFGGKFSKNFFTLWVVSELADISNRRL